MMRKITLLMIAASGLIICYFEHGVNVPLSAVGGCIAVLAIDQTGWQS